MAELEISINTTGSNIETLTQQLLGLESNINTVKLQTSDVRQQFILLQQHASTFDEIAGGVSSLASQLGTSNKEVQELNSMCSIVAGELRDGFFEAREGAVMLGDQVSYLDERLRTLATVEFDGLFSDAPTSIQNANDAIGEMEGKADKAKQGINSAKEGVDSLNDSLGNTSDLLDDVVDLGTSAGKSLAEEWKSIEGLSDKAQEFYDRIKNKFAFGTEYSQSIDLLFTHNDDVARPLLEAAAAGKDMDESLKLVKNTYDELREKGELNEEQAKNLDKVYSNLTQHIKIEFDIQSPQLDKFDYTPFVRSVEQGCNTATERIAALESFIEKVQEKSGHVKLGSKLLSSDEETQFIKALQEEINNVVPGLKSVDEYLDEIKSKAKSGLAKGASDEDINKSSMLAVSSDLKRVEAEIDAIDSKFETVEEKEKAGIDGLMMKADMYRAALRQLRQEQTETFDATSNNTQAASGESIFEVNSRKVYDLITQLHEYKEELDNIEFRDGSEGKIDTARDEELRRLISETTQEIVRSAAQAEAGAGASYKALSERLKNYQEQLKKLNEESDKFASNGNGVGVTQANEKISKLQEKIKETISLMDEQKRKQNDMRDISNDTQRQEFKENAWQTFMASADEYVEAKEKVAQYQEQIDALTASIEKMKEEEASGKEIDNNKYDEAKEKLASLRQEQEQYKVTSMTAFNTASVAIEGAIKRENDALVSAQEEIRRLQAEQAQMAENGDFVGAQKNIDRIDDLKARVEELKKSIADLKGQQGQFSTGALDGMEGKAQRMRTQIMNAREELMKMIQQGKYGTAEFMEMASATGDMKKSMLLANAAMQYFATPNSHLAALKTGLQGVAGGFSTVVGVMGMFNTKSEEMQAIQTKLQASIGVLVGLESTYNAVKQTSGVYLAMLELKTWAKTRADIAQAAATRSATVAQAAFNLVAKANPYVLIATAVLAVVGAVVAFTKAMKNNTKEAEKNKKKMEELKKAQEDYANSFVSEASKLRSKYEELKREWNSLKSTQEKNEFIKNNANGFDELGKSINNAAEAEKFFNEDTSNVVAAFEARARAAAAAAMMVEAYQKYYQQRADNANKIGKYKKVKAGESLDSLSGEEKDIIGKSIAKRNAGVNGVGAGKISLTEEEATRINIERNKRQSAKLKEANKKAAVDLKKSTDSLRKIEEKNIEDYKKRGFNFDGKTNKKGGKSGKTAAQKYNEEQDQIQKQKDQEKADAKSLAELRYQQEIDAEEAAIALLKDGYEKKRRERALQHKKDLHQIEQQTQEVEDELLDMARTTFEEEEDNKAKKNKNYRKVQWYTVEDEALKKVRESSDYKTQKTNETSQTNASNVQFERDIQEMYDSLISGAKNASAQLYTIEKNHNDRMRNLQEARNFAEEEGDAEKVKAISAAIVDEITEYSKKKLSVGSDSGASNANFAAALGGLDQVMNISKTLDEFGKQQLEVLKNYVKTAEFKNASPTDQKTILEAIQKLQIAGVGDMGTHKAAKAAKEFATELITASRKLTDETAKLEENIKARATAEQEIAAREKAIAYKRTEIEGFQASIKKGEDDLANATNQDQRSEAESLISTSEAYIRQCQNEIEVMQQEIIQRNDVMASLAEEGVALQNSVTTLQNQATFAAQGLNAARSQFQKGMEGVRGVMNGIRSLGNASNLSDVYDGVMSIVDSFKQALANTGKKIGEASEGISNATKKGVKATADAASDAAKAAAEGVGDVAAEVADKTADAAKEGAEKTGDALDGAKGAGWVGAAISMADLINEIGVEGLLDNISDMMEGAISGIIDSIVSGGLFKSLANSVVGSIMAPFEAIFGKAGNMEDLLEEVEQLQAQNEILAEVGKDLIDALKDSTAETARADYEKAKKALEAERVNQKKIAEDQLKMWERGSKSISSKMASDYSDSMSKLGITNVNSLFGMSKEEIQNLKLQNNGKDWADFLSDLREAAESSHNGDAEEILKALDRVGEIEDELDNLGDTLNEKITGISFDSMFDSFKSTLKDMKSSSEDFAAALEKDLNDAIINSIGDKYKEKLNDWYKDWSKKQERWTAMAKDGLTDSEKAVIEMERGELEKAKEQIVQQAIDERNNLRDSGIITEEVQNRQGATRGFEAMSSEQANELNGRFTALQVSNQGILNTAAQQLEQESLLNVTMMGIAEYTKDMSISINSLLDIQANAYLELQEINSNTAKAADVLTSALPSIEKLNTIAEKL